MHVLADLFITHGGMNSVSEAMHFGVPMLVLPVLNDQPINAEQVKRLGIGRRLRAFPLSAKRLYREAISVLRDQEIKIKAAQMRQQLRKDVGIAGAADRIEDYFSRVDK